MLFRSVFSSNGDNTHSRLTDQLIDQSDLVVIGSITAGQQIGQTVNFSLLVDLVLKGEAGAGTSLGVGWNDAWPTRIGRQLYQRELSGFYGMWFLRKDGTSGILALLPASGAGQTPIGRAYFPLGRDRVPKLTGGSVADRVASVLIAEVRATKALTAATGGLWGIADSAITTGFFQEMAADPDAKMHLVGVAGLARIHDNGAVADLVALVDRIPRSEGQGFALHAIEALGDGEAGRTLALGSLIKSPDFEVQFTAAQTLGSLHSRNSMPFLAILLESPDPRIRQQAIIGMSRFVDNLPRLTEENGPPSFKWSIPLGPPLYKTPETDLYRPDMTRLGDPVAELAYVQFWRSWWVRMQSQILENK